MDKVTYDPADPDQYVGESVRAHRKKLGMSLQQAAERSGLSISMISKIERGVTSPSLRSLYALSRGLSIPVDVLFSGGSAFRQPDPAEAGLVVRVADRKTMDFGKKRLTKELLTPQPIGKLELLMVILAPGGSTGDDVFSHDGEEGGLILTGALELHVDDTTVLLHPGDSFAFKSSRRHWYSNIAEVETRVLWVNTPPIY